jgi:hypothetical protein
MKICCDCSQPLMAHNDGGQVFDFTVAIGALRTWMGLRRQASPSKMTRTRRTRIENPALHNPDLVPAIRYTAKLPAVIQWDSIS